VGAVGNRIARCLIAGKQRVMSQVAESVDRSNCSINAALTGGSKELSGYDIASLSAPRVVHTLPPVKRMSGSGFFIQSQHSSSASRLSRSSESVTHYYRM